ncbi:ROK family transcriptional regulator [Streptomyces mirabilis]|jgi:predicted NBD/HSP70 family sugar kinase|uniref:Sugar kinase of the NBD/HSP70 family, may contain an N-terminal HTH domain n=1 Tax=Streptomyces mirabilis TaxID=68239 RepID=A0A1I2JK33_9ACTN|nr:ROK family transcriptional regulator [Streptomyces mirabilis]SFF54609.1 Sugar kinase of the NBD/HSP70 family, may contain an N-terminal HTH domain [Streptomyces mirabilis]
MAYVNRTNAESGVNLLALRSHNAALVLDLLRTAGEGGISRLELAERTGLTPQAVSKITARLRADGLVAEAGRRASTGGKPRTVLRLVPEAGHAVGLHLDRDEVTVVLCDLTGAVVAERRVPLDLGAGAEAVVESAAGEVEALLAGAGVSVLGVGVALPGPLDHARGVLHRVTGFPEWDGFPLRDALAGRLGVPVVVDKDTNAAALGIAVVGSGVGALGGGASGSAGPAGRSGASDPSGGSGGSGPLGSSGPSGLSSPLESFAYLHLGTGLGAGLVIGGGVHRGARTGAGEFGHQVIQLDGPPCGCGNRGCIEALCLAAVDRGAVGEAARVLGVGAANLVGLLDIDLVLLGGRTVAAHEEAFVRGVGAVLEERARLEGVDDGAIPVRVAPGGARGVAEGAAQLLLAPLFGRGED